MDGGGSLRISFHLTQPPIVTPAVAVLPLWLHITLNNSSLCGSQILGVGPLCFWLLGGLPCFPKYGKKTYCFYGSELKANPGC